MWPNPKEAADLVTFTEEILNGKLHFLCSLKDGQLTIFIKNGYYTYSYEYIVLLPGKLHAEYIDQF